MNLRKTQIMNKIIIIYHISKTPIQFSKIQSLIRCLFLHKICKSCLSRIFEALCGPILICAINNAINQSSMKTKSVQIFILKIYNRQKSQQNSKEKFLLYFRLHFVDRRPYMLIAHILKCGS